jgi:transcriptional regulator with XRE-family HTH domain
MFYDNFARLCEEHGISPSNLAVRLGISKGTFSNWKRGAEPLNPTKKKIADYFGLSVSELTSGKTNTPAGKADVTEDDIKFALFGGDRDVTDAQWEEVKRFAAYIRERDR